MTFEPNPAVELDLFPLGGPDPVAAVQTGAGRPGARRPRLKLPALGADRSPADHTVLHWLSPWWPGSHGGARPVKGAAGGLDSRCRAAAGCRRARPPSFTRRFQGSPPTVVLALTSCCRLSQLRTVLLV